MDSYDITRTRFQRLSILPTSFHRGAPSVIARRSGVDKDLPWLGKALHGRLNDQQARLAYTFRVVREYGALWS
jgi:hypothetical protein